MKRNETGYQGTSYCGSFGRLNTDSPASNPLPLSSAPSNPKSLPIDRRVWDFWPGTGTGTACDGDSPSSEPCLVLSCPGQACSARDATSISFPLIASFHPVLSCPVLSSSSFCISIPDLLIIHLDTCALRLFVVLR